MIYPYRFEAEIGDVVYSVTRDEYDNVHVEKVTIVKIQDNSYRVKVNKDGYFTNEIERSEDWKNCTIGYWIKEFSFGHAMYFGETLFLTEEEALNEERSIMEDKND